MGVTPMTSTGIGNARGACRRCEVMGRGIHCTYIGAVVVLRDADKCTLFIYFIIHAACKRQQYTHATFATLFGARTACLVASPPPTTPPTAAPSS
eukprot:5994149-Pyramimonas_sp.AAC.1